MYKFFVSIGSIIFSDTIIFVALFCHWLLRVLLSGFSSFGDHLSVFNLDIRTLIMFVFGLLFIEYE